jgi:hypothetical protein
LNISEEAHVKTWEKPKLIVLVRGRPEEALTLYCKGTGIATIPNDSFSSCEAVPGANNGVIECFGCVIVSVS